MKKAGCSINTIKKIARDFRNKEIPNCSTDCCEDASDMLGQLLKKKCPELELNAVWGTFNSKAHCWLETIDGAILDVTADQFGKYPRIWFPANPKHYTAYEVEKI